MSLVLDVNVLLFFPLDAVSGFGLGFSVTYQHIERFNMVCNRNCNVAMVCV